jgi:DNA mismatch endonuclease (patch repair protein)
MSKAQRSAAMSRIRGWGNKRTEADVIVLLRQAGIKGWRRHKAIAIVFHSVDSVLASDGTRFKAQVRPDFIFPQQRIALFIDGCFWHGCPKCYRQPKSRQAFWKAKVRRNRERDRFQTRALRKIGWRVCRVWECGLAPKSFGVLKKWLSKQAV